jgi:lactate 2-monooxygenase
LTAFPTTTLLKNEKIGVQSIFHKNKEVGLAQICADLGVPFVLSTASSSSIEEVSQASGHGPRWYQLYWPINDDDITISLLRRAHTAGFTVLVVTLDTWTPAWRPLDLDLGYLPMVNGTGNQIAFSDPVFRERFRRAHGIEVEDDIPLASREWLQIMVSGVAPAW